MRRSYSDPRGQGGINHYSYPAVALLNLGGIWTRAFINHVTKLKAASIQFSIPGLVWDKWLFHLIAHVSLSMHPIRYLYVLNLQSIGPFQRTASRGYSTIFRRYLFFFSFPSSRPSHRITRHRMIDHVSLANLLVYWANTLPFSEHATFKYLNYHLDRPCSWRGHLLSRVWIGQSFLPLCRSGIISVNPPRPP